MPPLFSQPRRVDEMSILGEEQSAWNERVSTANAALDPEQVSGGDGTINWWEALAPLLTMGVGAAIGGRSGAILGGSAGAGYLKGRVEADERFRKQRQMNEA